MKLSQQLSEQIFNITLQEDLDRWIRDVDKGIGGVSWAPVGGIENNVHTVEVASDPSLALVERPTNSIDALLDLRAIEQGETARTPHEAAIKWWGVPREGLSAMSDKERRNLADHIRVTMFEGESNDRPTIVIQDQGMGQHPDDFPRTHMSLLASNKKSSTHVWESTMLAEPLLTSSPNQRLLLPGVLPLFLKTVATKSESPLSNMTH